MPVVQRRPPAIQPVAARLGDRGPPPDSATPFIARYRALTVETDALDSDITEPATRPHPLLPGMPGVGTDAGCAPLVVGDNPRIGTALQTCR